MRSSSVSYRIWWLMNSVAIAACGMGAAVSFAAQPLTTESVVTGWVASYCIPILLILGRRVPLMAAAKLAGLIIFIGLPIACLCSLGFYAIQGYVGMVDVFCLLMQMLGWTALFVSAVSTTPAGARQRPENSESL